MNIAKAILSGKMCEDCVYYESCYYDQDCIAMFFLKKVAKFNENVHSNDTDKSGDKA